MRLTHLADYAVVMMTAAARRAEGERLSATELSEETGVPLPTAQKLMGKLAAAGLLTSVRGAGGGFTLAKPGHDISLADVIEAVEGPIAMAQCCGGDEASDCALDARCLVKPHMNIVSAAVRGALNAVSLERLATTNPAHPEERLSLSKTRLEGREEPVLRDGPSIRPSGYSVPPQDERVLDSGSRA
jgi:FeS assembly SUF system regulator